VIARVVFRSLRRVLHGVELWNGNRERWANLLSLDPERSVAAWAWSKHGHYRSLYPRLMRENTTLRFERIVDAADAERLIRSLPSVG